MSEQERETEVVAGVLEGVTQKRADTWQVAVKPAGSQYAKNLWTKDAEMVAMLGRELGREKIFTCNVSYWTNQSGQQVRSLWIEHEGGTAEVGDMTVTQFGGGRASQAAPKPDVDWDAKERRDYRSRAWAQALSALPKEEGELEPAYWERVKKLQRLIYADVTGAFGHSTDDFADIPFE